MVKARVQLLGSGPVTFHGRGRTLSQGSSVIVTDPSDIRYFQTQSQFTVTILEGAMSVSTPKPKVTTPKVKPSSLEEDFEEDDEGDFEEGDEVAPREKTREESRFDLGKLNKSQLMELSPELNIGMSKSAMIDFLLKE